MLILCGDQHKSQFFSSNFRRSQGFGALYGFSPSVVKLTLLNNLENVLICYPDVPCISTKKDNHTLGIIDTAGEVFNMLE